MHFSVSLELVFEYRARIINQFKWTLPLDMDQEQIIATYVNACALTNVADVIDSGLQKE